MPRRDVAARMMLPFVLILLCLDLCSAKLRASGVLIKGDSSGAPVVVFGDATSIKPEGGALSIQSNGTAISIGPGVMQLETLVANSSASLDSLSAGGKGQWTLWDLDSFDATDSNKWSINDHSFCGASMDSFLGGHCRFGATTTRRTYSNLPAHSKVKVTARVHYFDQWNGETVSMSLDDKPMWSQSHEWCPQFLTWMCRKYGLDSCGRDEPDRLSVKAEAILAHAGPNLAVTFASTLGQSVDPCYTSWGVDDVAVHVLV